MVAAAVVGSAVVGGAVSSRNASKAAKAQTSAANAANATQEYIFEQTREDQMPWLQAGNAGLNSLMGLYGFEQVRDTTGATPAQIAKLPASERAGIAGYFDNIFINQANKLAGSTAKADVNAIAAAEDLPMKWQMAANPSQTSNAFMVKDPGYQFRLSEGQRNLENSAASRGGLLSGNTLKATQKYGQDYASNEFTNIANRYGQLAGVGQATNNQLAATGQNYANAYGQNALAAGQARATGYQNQANALTGSINNALGLYGAYKGGLFG